MAYDTTLPVLPTPNTTPVGPGFVSQALIQNTTGMIHELNDGSSIGVEFNGSFWTINIAYPELTIAEAAPLIAFFNRIRGPFKSFYVSLPLHSIPQTGAWGSNINGLSVDILDDSLLRIDTWAGESGDADISINDSLKIGNSNKIYSVASRRVHNGHLELGLSSPIVNKDTVSGAVLDMAENNNIQYKVRLTSGMPQFELTPEGIYSGFTISMKENIR